MRYKGFDVVVASTDDPKRWEWSAMKAGRSVHAGDAFSEGAAVRLARTAIDRSVRVLAMNGSMPKPVRPADARVLAAGFDDTPAIDDRRQGPHHDRK